MEFLRKLFQDDPIDWLYKYWFISCILAVVYLVLLYAGTRFMKTRKAYNLQHVLILWNIGLATFSIIGCWKINVVGIARSLFTGGIYEVSCHTDAYNIPNQRFWILIVAFSKIVELGDTAFIVLRKSHLSFLHWYHHGTALMYAWFCLPMEDAPAAFFAGQNLVIHSAMYTYYALKAAGYRVPSQVALLITVSQILQMVAGIVLNTTALRALQRGEPCQYSYFSFYVGMLIYTSYLILFLQFFYRRYVAKPKLS